MRRIALMAVVAAGLTGCDGASYGVSVGYPYGGYGYGYPYSYDDGFRAGIYGPGIGYSPPVTRPPTGSINRPTTLPAYVGPRPGGGHAGGAGRAPRRMR
jgi:hypothetical protein